ncbi:Mu transposase C-terminal domain-containing protein [Halopseudomonas bauzanensis]|uniref:Mu transposase C-terminal domain-containing protein n=1 Tax=Halopseudomonas bauzanensis TaxID=653930 RepID=UPI0035247FB8
MTNLCESHDIAVGKAVVWDSLPYQIKSIKPALGDITLEGKGGIECSIDIQVFFNAIAAGDLEFPSRKVDSVSSETAWTETEKKEADFRLELITFIKKLDKSSASPEERNRRLVDFCSLYGKTVPTIRTIKTYQKLMDKHGYAGLVPAYHRRGGSGWASKRAAKEIAAKMVHDTFMRDDRINLSLASMLVNRELKTVGGEGVSRTIDRKTVSRIIMGMPKSSVKAGRLDPRTYALWNRQAVRSYDVSRPFERIEIDAKTIDVYCTDELGNLYSELTLYAMVCARTSYPVGIYVSGGKPSEYTLLKLLEFFFSPKDESFKERFNIETDWVAPCGISTLVLDNATENASDLVLAVVRQMGIQIEYARIARGDDKPHVESFFRTLDLQLFNSMPGAKNSRDKRVVNRHVQAQREASLTIDDIYQKVVKYVADVYIHKPRAELGFLHSQKMSIKSAMDRDLERFIPFPPPSLNEIQRLLLSAHRATRKLQHYGIDFEGFVFHSHELSRLAREQEIQNIELQYNPEDCTAVYVVDPKENILIRVQNKMLGLPRVSFAIAKQLRARYSKPGEMSGHDYQEVYAQMIDELRARKPRKPKIKENNQELRRQHGNQKRDDIERLLSQGSNAPSSTLPIYVNDDDDFEPSPRRAR